MRKKVRIEGLFFGWKLIRLCIRDSRYLRMTARSRKMAMDCETLFPLSSDAPSQLLQLLLHHLPFPSPPNQTHTHTHTHTHSLSLSLSLSLSIPKIPSNIQRSLHWDSSLYNLQTSKNKFTAYSKYWVLSNWLNFNSRDEIAGAKFLATRANSEIDPEQYHWYRVTGTHCWLLWLGNQPTQREQQTKRRGTFCNVNKTNEK